MSEPRRLTDKELLEVETTPRYAKDIPVWTIRSLLLTIAALKEEHREAQETLQLETNSIRQQLQWFETTYDTRACAPLFKARTKGQLCPHCKKHGMMKIGSAAGCGECGAVWTIEETEPDPVTP